MRLKDKVIIVTGSTTGIGEATARRCVEEGAKVLVHGRSRERGETLVKELGSAAVFHQDDLSVKEAPGRIVEAAVSAFGTVDGIVNNGAHIVRSNLETTDEDFFDKTVTINVRAPLMIIRNAIEHLKKNKGCVVNLGSVNGYCGETKQLAYSITKGGLQTMTRNLADAFCLDQVRFIHLVVGWVLTPNEHALKVKEGREPDWHEHPPTDMVPTGTMTKPEQIASMITFALSDESIPFSGGVWELEQYPWLGRHPRMAGENPDFTSDS